VHSSGKRVGLMTFKNLVVSVALLSVFTMAVRVSADTDTWWYLGAGRWVVKSCDKLRKEARGGAPD
jgi:hypothetical protein